MFAGLAGLAGALDSAGFVSTGGLGGFGHPLKGLPIGPLDLLIAAQVMAHDLTLVTNSTKEFERIHRLAIENWAG